MVIFSRDKHIFILPIGSTNSFTSCNLIASARTFIIMLSIKNTIGINWLTYFLVIVLLLLEMAKPTMFTVSVQVQKYKWIGHETCGTVVTFPNYKDFYILFMFMTVRIHMVGHIGQRSNLDFMKLQFYATMRGRK